jgi:CheY-like chemotaxis protein
MPDAVSVLHVDDDPDCLAVSSHAFERRSDVAEVVTADSTEAGLARLEEQSFDCVVSDSVRLPDGETFASAARRREPSTAFVLFTGNDDPDDARHADAVFLKGAAGSLSRVAEAAASTVGHAALGDEWTTVGRHDWGRRSELAVTLSGALARHLGCEPLELPTLYGAIDPEALEAFLSPDGDAAAGLTDGGYAEASVTFGYGDLDVRVTGSGHIAVR